MPELPEVEMARMIVQGTALGRRIDDIDVLDRKMFVKGTEEEMRRSFLGSEVTGTFRHGKNLLIGIGDRWLYVHLGMSGSLHMVGPGEGTPHQRLRLGMGGSVLVLDDPRRFGRFGLYRRPEDLVSEKGLGPDALRITDRELAERMEGRRGAIKPLLLDQSILAGVGNLYADECLFQEGLHPATGVRVMTGAELTGLGRRVRKVLETSIAAGTDFAKLPDGSLLRRREEGAPCPRCGRELASMRLGGRTTVLCPACQPFRADW